MIIFRWHLSAKRPGDYRRARTREQEVEGWFLLPLLFPLLCSSCLLVMEILCAVG